MPALREVEHYLTGLWLLIKGDPSGLTYLDLSERGSLRSFWAIFWCLPSIVLSWVWWRMGFLKSMAPTVDNAGLFYLRLGMVEMANWIVPLVLVGLITLLFGIGQKFNTIVVATNWLAVPVSYAYAALIVISILLPGLAGLVSLLWLALMMALIFTLSRLMRMICGQQPLLIGTITLTLLIPALILSDMLEQFLGVYPG